MICPFGFARAVPKVNWIVRVPLKELSKILCYSDGLYLVRISQWVKYFLGQINSISYYYDTQYVSDIDCLISSTFDSK